MYKECEFIKELPTKKMDPNNSFYEMDPTACSNQHNALAALRILRYNQLLLPPDVHNVVGPLLASLPPSLQNSLQTLPSSLQTLPAPQPCLPSFCQHMPLVNSPLLTPPPSDSEVRRRGEKRPIPPELKDEKYFERRRRNNQAAKKSRDARRIREDQVAWRACLLEQENASLRAHMAAMRQEALALRSLLAARDETAAPSSTTAD